HRDIKPENVLLSSGTAVVTDFGIAKALTASRTSDGIASRDDQGTLTQVGSSIGTPAYMAPEQAVGDAVDHRADLYAWGVVAYELLAGAHPFAGKTGTSQLIAAHIAETPRALIDLAPRIPRDVAALVMQCLAKAPSDRPESATAVRTRLEHVVTPSGERPAGIRPRALRARFIAPALVLLAVVAWAVTRQRAGTSPVPSATTAATDSTAPVRSLVVLPFESVGGDTANAYFAEGMADELSDALSKVPGLQLAGRSSAATFRGKSASPQEIGAALKVGAVLEGTVRRAGGKLRVSTQLTNASSGLVLWSETFDRDAKDVFAVQDDITKAIVSALRVTLAGGAGNAPTATRGTDDLEAYDLYQRGMYFYQRRGPGVTRALAYMQQAVARDPQFVDAQAMLGLIWPTPIRPCAMRCRRRARRANGRSVSTPVRPTPGPRWGQRGHTSTSGGPRRTRCAARVA
ncbi:MAG: protein kinase, partial [Polaromonas sp.]|nr:protein kinase [Gemmatimonadaceae bacterium]